MVEGVSYTSKTNKIDVVKTASKETNNSIIDDIFESQTETMDFDSPLEEIDFELEDNVEDSLDFNLTEEDLELLKGSMTQKEYDDFIQGMEKYYDGQITYLESLLNGYDGEEKFEGINNILDRIKSLFVEMDSIGYRRLKDELTAKIMDRVAFYAQNGDSYGLFKGTGLTREQFINMDYDAQLEFVKKYDKETKNLVYNLDSCNEQLDIMVKEKFSDLGIKTYKEIEKYQLELKNQKTQTKEAIKMTKNMRDSAKYDYIYFLEEFKDYKGNEITDSKLEEIDKYKLGYSDSNIVIETGKVLIHFDYTKYQEDHPDATPIDFAMMISEKYPGIDFDCKGIDNISELKDLVNISKYAPDMVKTLSFLYKNNPEEAKKYLEASKYEINNFNGQLKAKKFLETLAEKDGEDGLDEAFYNEFGVHLKGLVDGLDTFGEGVGYSIEVLLTGLGISGENRVLSVSDYEKMYILQALLSEKDKQKISLLDEDGNQIDPDSIIDFSKEYCGAYLSNNYEISQGIGNMLPSVLISMTNPVAGTVTMGVSAGGNAYHGAMVQGYDYYSSLIYGIYSGASEALTERFLGGLPGISVGNKKFIASMLSEAGEESLQGVLDALARKSFLGEDLPSNEQEWHDFILDIGKQGLYGAITAGYLNAPKAINTIINTKSFNTYINQHNVSDADINEVIKNFKENNPDLANLSDDIIIDKQGKKLKSLLNTRLINNTIKKYNCSIEIAMVIVDQKLTEDQAKYLIEKIKKETETHTIIEGSKEKPLTISLDMILSAVDGDIVDVPADYLDVYNIKLNKGEKIWYDKNDEKFYRVNKKGIPDKNNPIPNSYLNNPVDNASDRLISVTSKGKKAYLDPVTGRRFPETTKVSEDSQGYNHIFIGDIQYDKDGDIKGYKGGHSANSLKEQGYIVESSSVVEPAENGVYWGKWYDPNNPEITKNSTFFPDSWSKEDINKAIQEVGATKPLLINPDKGLSVHYGKVNGVELLIVDKRNNGEFGSAYPIYPGESIEKIVQALTDTTRTNSKGYIDIRKKGE